ncbi:UNVERIFIED_CONTAM: hypothetical protein GTU68_027872 [Idotea baltica]|nr:hypothetical protein [Idotea baltica]
MQILYVEDSPTLRISIASGLKKEGYHVTTASDGDEGLNAALIYDYDVIILDVMLPGVNGFEILRQIREAGNSAAVLMLTARVNIEDRVSGLDLGADDYLTKPFAFDELLARLRALLRRKFDAKSSVVTLAGLKIDLTARRLFFCDRELVVRPREFDILGYLALHLGKVVSRSELIEHLYDHATDLRSNVVDSAICNLRKILSQAGCPDIIETIPRRGYLLEEKPGKL